MQTLHRRKPAAAGPVQTAAWFHCRPRRRRPLNDRNVNRSTFAAAIEDTPRPRPCSQALGRVEQAPFAEGERRQATALPICNTSLRVVMRQPKWRMPYLPFTVEPNGDYRLASGPDPIWERQPNR